MNHWVFIINKILKCVERFRRLSSAALISSKTKKSSIIFRKSELSVQNREMFFCCVRRIGLRNEEMCPTNKMKKEKSDENKPQNWTSWTQNMSGLETSPVNKLIQRGGRAVWGGTHTRIQIYIHKYAHTQIHIHTHMKIDIYIVIHTQPYSVYSV